MQYRRPLSEHATLNGVQQMSDGSGRESGMAAGRASPPPTMDSIIARPSIEPGRRAHKLWTLPMTSRKILKHAASPCSMTRPAISRQPLKSRKMGLQIKWTTLLNRSIDPASNWKSNTLACKLPTMRSARRGLVKLMRRLTDHPRTPVRHRMRVGRLSVRFESVDIPNSATSTPARPSVLDPRA